MNLISQRKQMCETCVCEVLLPWHQCDTWESINGKQQNIKIYPSFRIQLIILDETRNTFWLFMEDIFLKKIYFKYILYNIGLTLLHGLTMLIIPLILHEFAISSARLRLAGRLIAHLLSIWIDTWPRNSNILFSASLNQNVHSPIWITFIN